MANEDMDGTFLGGGALDHVVHDGEIYLRSDQVAQVIGSTGIKMAIAAIQMNDSSSAATAQFLMIVSEKIFELRSELLKREIEAVLPDFGLIDPQSFFDLDD